MFLSQKKIYLLTVLTVSALIGIIIVQGYWINASFENEQKQFDNRFQELSIQFSQTIIDNPSLQKSAIRLLRGRSQEAKTAKLRSELQSKIDSLFNQQFNDTTYEFGLIERDTTSAMQEEVLFSSINGNNVTPILESEYNTCACVFDGAGQINFYFPNRDYYLASQMIGLLILSIIFILMVVGCMVYTILTIRKQKRLAKMKNDFINNMTHEFKTPIFSISLASKALSKSKEIQKSTKLNKYLDLISDETNRLKSQVDKVLQLALMNSDDANLNKQKIDLHTLIKQAVNNFDLQLSDRNGTIELELNADKHIIYADQTHISNIIHNLIDNAIKYSKDSPKITISTNDEKHGVSFSVNDNGIGMDAETKQHIFDRFYRAQTGNIHEEKGFGIGLSYVKNIVEAHEGWIKLKSKLNKGSTFTIFLPA